MITLLVADDHPVSRQGLISLLRNAPQDYQVVGEASSCAEIVAKVGELRPHVTIIESAMNRGEGIEAVKLIRSQFPDVKVLILTRSDDNDHFLQALKAGAQGYLLKTARPETLISSIHLVATGDAILSPFLNMRMMQDFQDSSGHPYEGSHVLTMREREILQIAAEGATNKEIAVKCFISETTVKAHFRNILEKLETHNRAGAVALATAKGLIREVSAVA